MGLKQDEYRYAFGNMEHIKCRMSCGAVGENPTYENLNLQNKVETVNEDSFYESIHFRVSIT